MARQERQARRQDEDGHRRRRRRRIPTDFTYISGCVKYTMFFFNLLFLLAGALFVSIGTYAVIDKWTSGETFRFENVYDVLFNLAFLIIIVGGVVFIVSFAGCIGALRENLCLLKFYSLCLLLFFVAEMVVAALGFIFPHKMSSFLEGTLSEELIRNYRDDIDLRNVIDLVQQDFKCCGISSEGYKDWSKNQYFNCTENNPAVERCGVPFSCCLTDSRSVSDDGLVNIMCGFGFQAKPYKEVVQHIYTQGCIQRLKVLVEQNIYTVAIVTLGVAIAQLLVIWLARTLEGQIGDQRSLWQY